MHDSLPLCIGDDGNLPDGTYVEITDDTRLEWIPLPDKV